MLLSGTDILAPAAANGFAVPAYNISDYGMMVAAIAACEEVGSPMFIAIHPSEWELVGDPFVASALEVARTSSVPVAIHLDHGATFEQAMAAVRLGFTSVMIDGSLLPYEQNVELTRRVVESAHAAGVSVEGEIGTIGPRDPRSAEEMKRFSYTTPEEASQFVADTGVDSLAVAIGTAHGVYPPGVKPEINVELVSRIAATVGVPLVLHGGSGAVDAEVTEAVSRGIAKVNVSADMKLAYFARLREVLSDPAVREPHDAYPPALDALKAAVRHKAEVFASVGAARHYDYRPVGLRAPIWTASAAPVLEH
ncbi:fructose-bisphosphate aldolase [Salana multivorans]|uniref:Fructose-bisphosphate aldolase n=1 Tax=Salana multivorans TaxID=120377 RepID=A0A3N2D2I2_9MICO|nr:ketose-bisphosphate aldolase [Salana multivorans]MBN8882521.1 ketose-bisphosphate aldolase [Salana multivorans]OJX95703.1 MAG: hypothetical protein BGO96_08820 [Micrococcales bacterium 73-15]ROR93973.1 fructose-bisphosphate aldolase [Salana multivorans]